VDMLKVMIPEALFVFSMRAPWPTIQSSTLKKKTSFIVPTEFVNSLPDNLILRAAATWAESIDVLRRECDANWLIVRHEELVARPYSVISELYNRAGLAQKAVAHAARLPEIRVRDYSFIKYQLMGHPYRAEIQALLEERARTFGYSASLSSLPGSGLRHAAAAAFHRLRRGKKQSRPRADSRLIVQGQSEGLVSGAF